MASLFGADAGLRTGASIAQVGDPGLDGPPVQLVDAPTGLVRGAVSFVAPTISLELIGAPGAAEAERKESTIRRTRVGVAVACDDRPVGPVAVTSAIHNLLSQPTVASLLVALFIVRDDLAPSLRAGLTLVVLTGAFTVGGVDVALCRVRTPKALPGRRSRVVACRRDHTVYDVYDVTGERSVSLRSRSSWVSSDPHRGGTP